MKPSIGRLVTVFLAESSNGSREAPALISRAWFEHDTIENPGAVNLHVFPDNAPSFLATSVTLYDTRELAEASGPGCLVAFVP